VRRAASLRRVPFLVLEVLIAENVARFDSIANDKFPNSRIFAQRTAED